jgi:hypothetical protein
MKKLILLATAVIFSAGIFAAPTVTKSIDATAKIRNVFHQNFPEVINPSIVNVGGLYLVYFADEKNNASCRIFYDADGNVIQTIRNYTAEGLTPYVRAKIDSKYKGKNIFGVTDVTNENEHYYEVMLQDDKSLWIVRANDIGSIYVQKKYKRAM